MTTYLSYLQEISNEKLALAAKEIIDFKNTGILVDGEIRKIAKMVTERVGDSTFSLTVAETCVLKEVAIRFVDEYLK